MMKPFSLDPVLNHRKRLEELARGRLFEAKASRDKAVEKLNEKKREYANLIEKRSLLHSQDSDVLDLIRVEEFLDFTKKQINEHEIIVKNKNDFVRQAEKNLVKKSKDKKALEKLKEKQNLQYRKYLNKKEAAMLDEIAILKQSR